MTGLKFVLILISLLTFVAGQLLFKRAMDRSRTHAFGRKFAKWLVAGVASMTISFFLTLGLLQHLDLSYLYPFQGLSVIIIGVMAALVLKEKLTLRLALGALLITAGVILVSMS
jgi:drug/metabolite transporter (DMT)-like permease